MTIFITISRGIIARNLLQNKFYDLVKKNFDKIVLITTASEDKRFAREFSAPNVEIIPMPTEPDKAWESILSNLYKFLIFNKSTLGHGMYWYSKVPTRLKWIFKVIRFFLLSIIFYPLSKISAVRSTVQWFDGKFLQQESRKQYEKLIDDYKPDIVFVANMLEEAALLKAAKNRSVQTVAMAKTWDNLSKRYFRSRADHILSWSSFMKDELIQLQDYKEDEITVVGVPQFDYYVDESEYESREDFCSRVGLDPNKKIICLGSEGKIMPSDKDIAKVIHDLVQDNKLDYDCQLFIRPHFGHTNDAQKFSELKGLENVVIDSCNNPSEGFDDSWDYSKTQMKHFLSILRYSDVLLNSASTLSLDSAAAGTPTIYIKFDGYNKKSLFESGRRWYVCDYLDELMSFNAGLVAYDIESLRGFINAHLENPKLFAENQSKLRARLCPLMDGRAGERLFEKIYQQVKK